MNNAFNGTISQSVKLTGGAKIGWFQASWPFATLMADKNKLELNASLVGNLLFRPSDIISIEPVSSLAGYNIKINHSVQNYNSVIMFKTRGNVGQLITCIRGNRFSG